MCAGCSRRHLSSRRFESPVAAIPPRRPSRLAELRRLCRTHPPVAPGSLPRIGESLLPPRGSSPPPPARALTAALLGGYVPPRSSVFRVPRSATTARSSPIIAAMRRPDRPCRGRSRRPVGFLFELASEQPRSPHVAVDHHPRQVRVDGELARESEFAVRRRGGEGCPRTHGGAARTAETAAATARARQSNEGRVKGRERSHVGASLPARPRRDRLENFAIHTSPPPSPSRLPPFASRHPPTFVPFPPPSRHLHTSPPRATLAPLPPSHLDRPERTHVQRARQDPPVERACGDDASHDEASSAQQYDE